MTSKTYLEIFKENLSLVGKEFIFYCGDDMKHKLYKYNLKLCTVVNAGMDCGIERLMYVKFKDGKTFQVSSLDLFKFKVKES